MGGRGSSSGKGGGGGSSSGVGASFDSNGVSNKMREDAKGTSAERTIARMDAGKTGSEIGTNVDRVASHVLRDQGVESPSADQIVAIAKKWGYDAATRPDYYDPRDTKLDYIRLPKR